MNTISRLIDRFLCWYGFHAVSHIMNVDEARCYSVCDKCGKQGWIDAQGFLCSYHEPP